MSAQELFHWSDDFSIHVQEIDEQHKVLVGLLNQLHEAIYQKQGKAASRKILDQLAEYTRTHFLLEESLMRVTHYPDFTAHKQQHEDLIRQISELQHKLDDDKVTITFELLHFLKTWLTHHINNSDRRFGDYFTQNPQTQGYAQWNKEVAATMEKKAWWKFW